MADTSTAALLCLRSVMKRKVFNRWHRLSLPDDAVFYADEAGRKEYVLNDHGVIYQGSVDNMTHRSWDYGQVGSDLCTS